MRRGLPCPLCGRVLVVRESKKSKPYLVCFDCGLQLFVRGPNGIRLLRAKSHRRLKEGSPGHVSPGEPAALKEE